MANVRIDQLTNSTVVGWASGPVGFTRVDANTASFTGTGGLNFTRVNLAEKATAGTPVAGFGEIWTKTGTPNTLWFTDDTGSDFQIGLPGAGNVSASPTPVDNQIAIWTDATTIEGDVDLTFDGTTLTVGTLSVTPYSSSNDFVIAVTTIAGMSIMSSDSGSCYLTFGNVTNNRGGEVIWSDATESLTLRTHNVGGVINFQTDNGQPLVNFTTSAVAVQAGKTIEVDTISETTPAAGVTIEGITITDDTISTPSNPILLSPGDSVNIDANIVFTGPQQIGTTSGDLTLAPTGNVVSDSSIITPEIIAPKNINIVSHASDDAVGIADGTIAFTVPVELNGYDLTDVTCSVYSKGITNETKVWIRRRRAGLDDLMLGTPVTLGNEFFASDGIPDPANDDVLTGDQIYVDVTDIHTTPPNGLSTVLTFTKP